MYNSGTLSDDDLTLVEDYVLGELSPEVAAEVERRVQGDRALYQELCALQATLRLLPQALPTLEAPSDLRDRILSSHDLRNKILNADSLLPASAAPQPIPAVGTIQWPTLPWGKLIAGLAAGLALLLGANNLHLRQALSHAEQTNLELLAQLDQNDTETVAGLLQQPNSRLVALEGEGDDVAAATGTLLFTPGQWHQVVVSLSDLPPLPPQEIYRMWLTLENGQVIFCGEFNTDELGQVFVDLHPEDEVPPGVRATGIFVTVESASAPPEPTGERVMAGSI